MADKKGLNGRRMFLRSLCFDKKSVHINQLVAEEAYIDRNPTRARNPRVDNNLEGSRFSIEVAKSMERKLSMLTWDAIPKTQSSGDDNDDMSSDASSDLFEIDMAAAYDVSICMSPPWHYAPSEGSIQWSIVTASAVDYSYASDCNDDMSGRVAGDRILKEARKWWHGGILSCRRQKAVDVAQNVTFKKSIAL